MHTFTTVSFYHSAPLGLSTLITVVSRYGFYAHAHHRLRDHTAAFAFACPPPRFYHLHARVYTLFVGSAAPAPTYQHPSQFSITCWTTAAVLRAFAVHRLPCIVWIVSPTCRLRYIPCRRYVRTYFVRLFSLPYICLHFWAAA